MTARPERGRPPGARQRLTWKWRVLTALTLTFVRLVRWRIDVQGLEHVPPAGGAVLAFNHHSYFDFVMLAWGPVLRMGRTVRFLAKREIWASPWTRWMGRWVEAVPVDRDSAAARADAYGAAVAALGAGDLVAVAPEQTISTSFELLPFRTGAARMAQRAGVPIVPVVGWGTHRLATKGVGIRVRDGRGIPVVIRYGPPVHVSADEDPRDATERLQEAMSALLDDVQRGYEDGAPAGAWWVPARLGGGAPPHAEVRREHERRFPPGGAPPD